MLGCEGEWGDKECALGNRECWSVLVWRLYYFRLAGWVREEYFVTRPAAKLATRDDRAM